MTTKNGTGNSILDGYRSKGLAGRVGFGRRPAIVVVDFIVGFTDSESPLASALDPQIEATNTLLETARSRSIPVYFTTTVYQPDLTDAGLFISKIPSLKILVRGSRWVDLDPRLHRQPSEPIIEKQYASAFFGTVLASSLTANGIDTLIVTGCTTSGCVRATVVDALQHGFRAIVPRECVGDRSSEQHAANLIDMDGKYGDVIDLADAISALEHLEGTPQMTASVPRRVHHIDVVVRDLDQAEDRYRRVLGIEPLPRESLQSRGIDLVRFRIGETWLILVQPTREDSPVAAFLRAHGEGFFHMAIEVDDIENEARSLRSRGVRLTCEETRIGIDGWKLIDIELDETLGAMIQLIEAPEKR